MKQSAMPDTSLRCLLLVEDDEGTLLRRTRDKIILHLKPAGGVSVSDFVDAFFEAYRSGQFSEYESPFFNLFNYPSELSIIERGDCQQFERRVKEFKGVNGWPDGTHLFFSDYFRQGDSSVRVSDVAFSTNGWYLSITKATRTGHIAPFVDGKIYCDRDSNHILEVYQGGYRIVKEFMPH